MIKLRNQTDFFAGLLFIVIGAVAAYLASDYRFGSAMQMGPGYLPSVLAWGVMIVGAIVMASSFAVDGPKVPAFGWRPLIFVLGSMVLFGLLIGPFGLVVAICATVLTGGLAFKGVRPLELVVLAVLLSIFSVTLFVVLLGQTIAIWPRF